MSILQTFSKSLEAEHERTSTQLKEMTAVAADEAGKCKSAKEVIKPLTAQVGYSISRVSFFSYSALVSMF